MQDFRARIDRELDEVRAKPEHFNLAQPLETAKILIRGGNLALCHCLLKYLASRHQNDDPDSRLELLAFLIGEHLGPEFIQLPEQERPEAFDDGTAGVGPLPDDPIAEPIAQDRPFPYVSRGRGFRTTHYVGNRIEGEPQNGNTPKAMAITPHSNVGGFFGGAANSEAAAEAAAYIVPVDDESVVSEVKHDGWNLMEEHENKEYGDGGGEDRPVWGQVQAEHPDSANSQSSHSLDDDDSLHARAHEANPPSGSQDDGRNSSAAANKGVGNGHKSSQSQPERADKDKGKKPALSKPNHSQGKRNSGLRRMRYKLPLRCTSPRSDAQWSIAKTLFIFALGVTAGSAVSLVVLGGLAEMGLWGVKRGTPAVVYPTRQLENAFDEELEENEPYEQAEYPTLEQDQQTDHGESGAEEGGRDMKNLSAHPKQERQSPNRSPTGQQ